MESQVTCNARLARLCHNGRISAGHRMIGRYTREQIDVKVKPIDDGQLYCIQPGQHWRRRNSTLAAPATTSPCLIGIRSGGTGLARN